ncbi:MAG TPA: prepilin-type N-terminal cleavage/methylation domain-containing protein [Gammaproteobacteria bacterium]|nr:prepilin-type N-terminal cleavage/methylation domain-containing protein [Gammaproteobacteria bacterium]
MRVRGLTLVELLVTLVILSILAAVALPYAEVALRREQELELRRSLRAIREAIDVFHEDWRYGRFSSLADEVSDNGYPESLEALVDGVALADAAGTKKRYLRRIPADPFADSDAPLREQWRMLGYEDAPNSSIWGGEDVYDVRSTSERQALNGTYYKDW